MRTFLMTMCNLKGVGRISTEHSCNVRYNDDDDNNNNHNHNHNNILRLLLSPNRKKEP